MRTLIDDGVMLAEEVYAGWVLVRWVGEQSKRFSRKLYEDLKRLETHIRLTGLKGWLVASEFQYKNMHKILERLGAVQYGKDDETLFFRKEITI